MCIPSLRSLKFDARIGGELGGIWAVVWVVRGKAVLVWLSLFFNTKSIIYSKIIGCTLLAKFAVG